VDKARSHYSFVGFLVASVAGVGLNAQSSVAPSFKRDMLGNLVPHVRAAAAIVYDPQTGAVLWEENMHDQRSIASAKLMTAVTFCLMLPSWPAGARDARPAGPP
jgi:D-alanyl-D-alanine carboxypeptidase